MNEQDNQQNQASESTQTSQPTAETTSATAVNHEAGKKSLTKVYIISIVLAVAVILGALYFLESEGRSNTNIFSLGDNDTEQTGEGNGGEVVAEVNGTQIVESELSTSMQQFAQMAQAQGVDLSTPEAQADIRGQALDVLINTELLKQEAREQGIEVTQEQIDQRLDNIVTELGGQEALDARIQELGIPEEQLVADIEEEILIQSYLDSVFAQSEITVTEEEVQAIYDEAGGAEGDLPPLEEVRPQIEQQITTTQEQEIIDQLLVELKADAEIEVM